jgi:hypothetical protein
MQVAELSSSPHQDTLKFILHCCTGRQHEYRPSPPGTEASVDIQFVPSFPAARTFGIYASFPQQTSGGSRFDRYIPASVSATQ